MNLPFTHFRACRAGRGTGPCALVTPVHYPMQFENSLIEFNVRMDTVLNCMCLKTLPEIDNIEPKSNSKFISSHTFLVEEKPILSFSCSVYEIQTQNLFCKSQHIDYSTVQSQS